MPFVKVFLLVFFRLQIHIWLRKERVIRRGFSVGQRESAGSEIGTGRHFRRRRNGENIGAGARSSWLSFSQVSRVLNDSRDGATRTGATRTGATVDSGAISTPSTITIPHTHDAALNVANVFVSRRQNERRGWQRQRVGVEISSFQIGAKRRSSAIRRCLGHVGASPPETTPPTPLSSCTTACVSSILSSGFDFPPQK